MKWLFSPAISLMNRLHIPMKFLLLALLNLCAVAVIAYSLQTNLNQAIVTSQHELEGLRRVKLVTDSKKMLQQHRGLSNGLLSGDASLRRTLERKSVEMLADVRMLVQELPARLTMSDDWRNIETGWNEIGTSGLNWSASNNFLAHTHLIYQLQILNQQVSDSYFLSVDPDIDSHYLIDTAIVTLPEALEKLGQIRGTGTGLLAQKAISERDKRQILTLVADLQTARQSLGINLDKVARYNPEVGAKLTSAFRVIDISLLKLLEQVQSTILSGNADLSPRDYFEMATAVIDKGYLQLQEKMLPTAEGLIKARIQRLKTEMLLGIGVALLLLLLAYYLLVGIYHSMVDGIQSLAHTAQKFGEGDFSSRVSLDGQDELSSVGDRFNQMADGLQELLDMHREDQESLQAIVDSALDAVVQMDSNGRITGWSRHAENTFGWSGEEAIGRALHETIIPARHRDAHVHGLKRFMASGIGSVLNKRIEIEGLHRDGHEFPIELAISSLKTERGVWFCAFVRDISTRRKTEADSRIAAIAFETGEGITITDENAIILNVNSSFTRITGYSAEDVIGQTPAILKSGRQDDTFYQTLWESLAENKSWTGEIWNRRKNGEVYPEWLSIAAVANDAGQITNYVGSFSDITQRKKSEETIHSLAFYDPLTQLPNRRLLQDRLQQALAFSNRSKRHGALLFVDLDNFKTLNDTRGHDVGDLLLRQVAQRLSTCVREGDTVARLGGDEFVVMLENLSEEKQQAAIQAEMVGEKILGTLNQSYLLDSYTHYNTPSIGVTLFNDHQGTIDDLLKRADLAMYQAKAAGRNAMRFFDPEMQAVVSKRATLEADLREALALSQFALHYQPQVSGAGHLTGVETLLRWQHPRRGMVSPAEFIPLAEESGLILPLGRWVLEAACTQLKLWASLPNAAHLMIGVNVSARQFNQLNFVSQVLEVLEKTGANPYRLTLELTESSLVTNVEDVIGKIVALKARGVGFALDDFGTGYSSLSYLKRLPLDTLKIDQSFVRDLLSDVNSASIAKTIVVLAQNLGMGVMAEGVETEAQRDFLASAGCHSYQGFLFGRPAPIDVLQQSFPNVLALNR